MSDSAELRSKILSFLMTEWARTENHQLVSVELLYAPGRGYKEEPIRKWVRADEPELFAELGKLEGLVMQIIEIAEGEADAKPSGKHRFVIKTKQHFGERQMMSFALSPTYNGDDETAIVPAGGGRTGGGGGGSDIAAAQILAGNNGQLMRINAQMFDAALRPLAQQNTQLLTELISLRSENSELQRKLSQAESNQMDREFQIAMAADKNARTNAAFQKVLQLGTVVISKFGADAKQLGGGEGSLALLINELKASLREDQIGGLMQIFDMPQKILFMEIMNKVNPPEKPPQGGPQGQAPGGINGSRS